MFAQPRLGSPVKQALDAYLNFSTSSPILHSIFWKGGLYLFLTLTMTGVFTLLRSRQFILLAIPTLINCLSLAISIPVQNFRYVYPFMPAAILIVLFGLLSTRMDVRKTKNATFHT